MPINEAEIVASDTYQGRQLAITETHYAPTVHASGQLRTSGYTLRRGWIDGHSFRCPAGTNDHALTKLRSYVDVEIEDAELRPRLTELIGTARYTEVDAVMGAPAVGSVAYIYAMGALRRGLVIKVTKTRATVAYTTRSSGGRIYRKAARLALVVDGDLYAPKAG